MPRTGENIYKRKDGRWEGRFIYSYDENGKAKYKYVYSKNYSELKQKLRVVTSSKTHKKGAIKGTAKMKYEYWLNAWLDDKKSKVKKSTYIRYRNLIINHILPKLGSYKIERISTDLLNKCLDDFLTDGRLDGTGGLSAKTVNDILIVVRESFQYAKSFDVPIICNFEKINIQKSHYEMRVLSKSEQERLTKYLRKDMDLCKLGVLICLFTGIRIGELCALKWKNISLEDKTLKVQHTMQRLQNEDITSLQKTQIIITAPKSFSSLRTIPLPECLIEVMSKFKNRPNAFLLTGKCNSYLEPRRMQEYFKKYLKESKIENANFHSLRHSFCTNCIETGFDLKSLSEILGHSSVKITLDKYAHSSMQLKKENIDKLKLI